MTTPIYQNRPWVDGSNWAGCRLSAFAAQGRELTFSTRPICGRWSNRHRKRFVYFGEEE
ncbi:MAG: hypothetical protein AAFQ27_01155 [Pseudomonadota bacterium]